MLVVSESLCLQVYEVSRHERTGLWGGRQRAHPVQARVLGGQGQKDILSQSNREKKSKVMTPSSYFPLLSFGIRLCSADISNFPVIVYKQSNT